LTTAQLDTPGSPMLAVVGPEVELWRKLLGILRMWSGTRSRTPPRKEPWDEDDLDSSDRARAVRPGGDVRPSGRSHRPDRARSGRWNPWPGGRTGLHAERRREGIQRQDRPGHHAGQPEMGHLPAHHA